MNTDTTFWEIDPLRSSIAFSVRHLMFAKVHGNFKKFTGKLSLDRSDPSKSSVEALIDVRSVDTGDAKRDEHLLGREFFQAEEFPFIKFKSREFRREGKHHLILGDLQLHGVTRAVTLDVQGLESEVQDSAGRVSIDASATTQIKRKEFGLSWSAAIEAGGMLVGDDISIVLNIKFVRSA